MKKCTIKAACFFTGMIISLHGWAQTKPLPGDPIEISLGENTVKIILQENKTVEQLTGIVRSWDMINYKASGQTPELAAREFISTYYKELGLADPALTDLKLHIVQPMLSGTVIRYRQHFSGIPVNGAKGEITIKINKDNEVTSLVNGYQKLSGKLRVNPTIDKRRAVANIKRLLKIPDDFTGIQGDKLAIIKSGNIEKLVYQYRFKHPSWNNEYRVSADAATGEVLEALNESMFIDGNGKVFKPDPLSSSRKPYGSTGFEDNNDANSPQLTEQLKDVVLKDIEFTGTLFLLRGPYAEIADFDTPNKGLFAQSTNTFNFNRSDDAFEAVMCYYYIDYALRYINEDLGIFCKPSLNNGRVRYDPSGWNGTDQSSYSTGSQTLSFGEGGVDDAEDADAILHELAHGIHDWITSGGLSNVDGLSEGFSDFWALSYSRSIMQWTTGQPEFNWIYNWDGHNTYWNGRDAAITTTYSETGGGIHNRGRVFSTAMMKIWNDIGRRKAEVIALEGLAMTGANTTQPQAAAKILQAAIDLNYPANELCLIKQRFDEAGYTGLPVFAKATTSDIFMRDAPDDAGLEVNPAGGAMWVSEDVWVRNSDDKSLEHQNPDYIPGSPVTVYVRVRNRGCAATEGNEQLKLYFAKAATGQSWTSPWDGTLNTDPEQPMGNPIGTQSIGASLGVGEEKILKFTWQPPNSNRYVSFGADKGHFCLLARIETSALAPYGMTFPENQDLYGNVKNNNNIVWKNITINSIYKAGFPLHETAGCVIVRNMADDNTEVRLRLETPSGEEANGLLKTYNVQYQLEPKLYAMWIEQGMRGYGVEPVGDLIYRINQGAWIGLNLPEDVAYNVCIVLTEPITPVTTPIKEGIYKFDLVQEGTNGIQGGERFVVKYLESTSAEIQTSEPMFSSEGRFESTSGNRQGISPVYPIQNVNVFPNPAGEHLNISVTQPGEHTATIYDLAGREIYSNKFLINEIVKTDNFIKGLYFLKVTDNHGHNHFQRIILE